MRPLLTFFTLLAVLAIHPGAQVRGENQGASVALDGPRPPIAERRPSRSVHHGIELTDDYAWLKAANWREVVQDPSRLAPDIRAYIDAENAYATAVLAPLGSFRAKLLAELKGRVQQDDSTVPSPDGPYVYWSRFQPGAEHGQVMRARRDGSGEEVLVDGPAMAVNAGYFQIGGYEHSPDHSLFAFTVDTTGSETTDLHIRALRPGGTSYIIPAVVDFSWASDNKTMFYVRRDAELRPRLVYRHTVGTDPANDVRVYEEKDPAFDISVLRTRSGRFIVLQLGNHDSTEVRLIDAHRPDGPVTVVEPRRPGLRYYVNDWGDDLVIRTDADGAVDFKLMTAPAASPGRENWRDLIPAKEGRQIESFTAFANHLVRVEIEEGLQRLVIRRKSDGVEHTVAFEAEAYSLSSWGGYEFNTTVTRFAISTPATPLQVYDYDMETKERTLRKQQRVPSGHDPSAYTVRRLFAPAPDGELVPITVLHRRDLALDGTAPVFLSAYGAYAESSTADFNENAFTLVDRGFVYATAHVRGGLEKGNRWREGGRRANKPNTFTDFIAVAEHLIRERYTSAGRIVPHGSSAGGLLVGAVVNLRPELWSAAVAGVPFVDALNTMLDPDLPLSASDVPEWGNPITDPDAFRVIQSYSPYDNVRAQPYPPMLVTAGISDPRVTYWEPAKWVAKLRALKTNDTRLVLVTQMSAGHGGVSGRFASLDEVAMIYAFVLDCAGRREPDTAVPSPR